MVLEFHLTNLNENEKNNFICSCGGNDKKLSIFIGKEQKFNISKLNDIQRITNLNPRYFEVNTVDKFEEIELGKYNINEFELELDKI